MLISFIRAVLLYLILIFTIRLMGKRQIGQLEPSEFVVTMLIADLAAIPMQDSAVPLLSGLIPILTILSVELLLSYFSMRSSWIRRVFCGKPVILMEEGKIIGRNLRRTRISVDELTEHLRELGIVELSEVKYAILETNGKISILLYSEYNPPSAKDCAISVDELELPYTLVCDGRLMRANLALCGKTETWVREQLSRRNCALKETLLLSATLSGKLYLSMRSEGKQ